jgi:ATP phosphoribosyltransferase regulatory subunit
MNKGYDARPMIGLEDAFGVRAAALRALQNTLMAAFSGAGYEEVIPPLAERPDSLNRGAGSFLADQTLMFSDPADAGLLAIRPDITPQIARIAATRLRDDAVLRLSYSGPVMLARPDSLRGSRQQWQTGIEFLGVADCEADIEVMHLAATAMHQAGFSDPVLLVGHLSLLEALVAGDDSDVEAWAAVLRRQSLEDMQHMLSRAELPDAHAEALLTMAAGRADATWLQQASGLPPAFAQAAKDLLHLVEQVRERLQGEVDVRADASVMPRFLYHTGIVFAGFAPNAAQALLHGGRYDRMMALHGRDMPATGFSCDLWAWLDALSAKV